MQFALVAAWGLLLGMVSSSLTGLILVLVMPLLAIGYFACAYSVFAQSGLWLPLVTPMLGQPIVTLIIALQSQYRQVRDENDRIVSRLKIEVPKWVVNQLLRGEREIAPEGEKCFGVCLHSDVKEYVKLAETLTPTQLHDLLNRYFSVLFDSVSRHGGFVIDVAGDGMMAVWREGKPEDPPQAKACLAALEISSKVNSQQFSGSAPQLPTRIGLHCGEVTLGHIGSEKHKEYRVIGSVVNASQRIESLNKHLGTRVLVSRAVVEKVPGMASRRIGCFCLRGLKEPLEIFELGRRAEEAATDITWLHDQYTEALGLFEARNWRKATTAFRNILDRVPDDGPSLYLLGLCETYENTPPPPHWDGALSIE
jgi:adenylate cyclase